MNKKLAKIIRVITIPPIMVLGVLTLFFFERNDIFTNVWQLFWASLFLMIMPLSAYPLSYIIPNIRSKEREGQRNLAFILSLLGYSAGLIYAFLLNISNYLFIPYRAL